MSVYSMLLGLILIINIVRNSRADIPKCDYFDTVDISDLERISDTYTYNGLKISANLTGEYNYTKFINGFKEPVKTHLRGCVCKVRPCVRICCPRKNMLANGKCDDDFNVGVKMINLTLDGKNVQIRTYDDLGITPQSTYTDVIVLRVPFHKCDEVLSLREDEYIMLEDGTLYYFNTGELFNPKNYCLYPQFHSHFPKSIWVVRHKCVQIYPPANINAAVMMISLTCYILTGSVYLYVKNLRNVLGKCIICSLLSKSVVTVLQILNALNWLSQHCSLKGYSLHFFNAVANLWDSVISFHLWKTLTSMSREEPRNQFLTYSAFAWGTCAILTGVIYGTNQAWEKDLHKWNWMPLVGYHECRMKDQPFLWLYSVLPMIRTTFNVIMFILTLIHIWKTKSELKKFKRDNERTAACFNIDSEVYLMFLRISVIMGAIWIMDFIYFFGTNNSFFRTLNTSVLYFENAFGTVVFMLLILKRSTLKMLMERNRNRR